MHSILSLYLFKPVFQYHSLGLWTSVCIVGFTTHTITELKGKSWNSWNCFFMSGNYLFRSKIYLGNQHPLFVFVSIYMTTINHVIIRLVTIASGRAKIAVIIDVSPTWEKLTLWLPLNINHILVETSGIPTRFDTPRLCLESLDNSKRKCCRFETWGSVSWNRVLLWPLCIILSWCLRCRLNTSCVI